MVNPTSLKRHLNKGYQRLLARLDNACEKQPEHAGAANGAHISTTDPNASVVRRGGGKSRLKYQVHRVVDERCEIITATEVTNGSVHEAHRMDSLLDAHAHNTGVSAEFSDADSKHGIIENYLGCHDRGVKSHFVSLELGQRGSGRQSEILPKESFTYDEAADCFVCPAGERLTRRRFNSQRQQWECTASKRMCSRCGLQLQCTRSKAERSLKRHLRQPALDKMLSQAESSQGRADRKTRQHLMGRSLARGTRYGIKQAHWRRLWRIEIQEYLTATIQNMVLLTRYLKEPLRALSAALSPAADRGSSQKLNRWRIPAPRTIATLTRHMAALKCVSLSRKFTALRFA